MATYQGKKVVGHLPAAAKAKEMPCSLFLRLAAPLMPASLALAHCETRNFSSRLPHSGQCAQRTGGWTMSGELGARTFLTAGS
jgi:hypothetical protein